VQLYTHAFQGPDGKWYIEYCPTTINQPCPVCEANKVMHNSSDDSLKKQASARKRKMSYISNIFVVRDAKAQQNEGQVFLFRYGVRIMNKIKDLISPEFTDIEASDPFDPDTGSNFRLRVVTNGPFPDYDKSTFDKASPLGDEATIETILKQCRSLEEIVDPRNFKSYHDLKAKFEGVVGTSMPANDDEVAVTGR